MDLERGLDYSPREVTIATTRREQLQPPRGCNFFLAMRDLQQGVTL